MSEFEIPQWRVEATEYRLLNESLHSLVADYNGVLVALTPVVDEYGARVDVRVNTGHDVFASERGELGEIERYYPRALWPSLAFRGKRYDNKPCGDPVAEQWCVAVALFMLSDAVHEQIVDIAGGDGSARDVLTDTTVACEFDTSDVIELSRVADILKGQ